MTTVKPAQTYLNVHGQILTNQSAVCRDREVTMHVIIRRSRWTFLASILIGIAGAALLIIPPAVTQSLATLIEPLLSDELPVTFLLLGGILVIIAVCIFVAELQLHRHTAVQIINKELVIIKHGTIKGQLHAADIVTSTYFQGFFGRKTDTALLTIHAQVPRRNGSVKQKSFKIGRIAAASAAYDAMVSFCGTRPARRSKQTVQPAEPRTKKTASAAETKTPAKTPAKSSAKSAAKPAAKKSAAAAEDNTKQTTNDEFAYPEVTRGTVKPRKKSSVDVSIPVTEKEAAARTEYLERTAGSDKGAEFEDEIDDLLHTRDAIPTHHYTLKNLYVPFTDGSGRLTEIDNIAIAESGIYVIECKNYDGTIFGKKDARSWTVVYDSGETRDFYSPILQNQGHIRTLSGLLNIPESSFRSIIVFSGHCNLTGIKFSRENLSICSTETLPKDLRTRTRTDKHVLSAKEVDEVFAALVPYTETSFEDRLRHLNQVEKKAQESA